MKEITSVSNQKIKEYAKLHQKKYREDSDFFIVEGKKALEDLIAKKIDIKQIFVMNKKTELLSDKMILVNNAVMKKLSTTDSAAEIVTIAIKPKVKIEDIKKLNKIALLEDIKDAGNLGTIIRSAAAFGIDTIILTGDCIDIYNPKVIRAAAGNFFKIPILENINALDLKNLFPKHKIISTGLYSTNNVEISQLNKTKNFIIMFGAEAEGLSKDLLKSADSNIRLNMSSSVESLNLAVASSIIFYELSKTF